MEIQRDIHEDNFTTFEWLLNVKKIVVINLYLKILD